jgi:hypothetical protein
MRQPQDRAEKNGYGDEKSEIAWRNSQRSQQENVTQRHQDYGDHDDEKCPVHELGGRTVLRPAGVRLPQNHISYMRARRQAPQQAGNLVVEIFS